MLWFIGAGILLFYAAESGLLTGSNPFVSASTNANAESLYNAAAQYLAPAIQAQAGLKSTMTLAQANALVAQFDAFQAANPNSQVGWSGTAWVAIPNSQFSVVPGSRD